MIRVFALDAEEQDRYAHVPVQDSARARVVVLPWLVAGIAGMTLGRWVLVRCGHETDRPLLAHELVHVRQWREDGAVGFLARYLGAYALARVRGHGHWDAYRAIPYEAEARALAGR